MKIIGIGIDIVEVNRIKKIFSKKFMEKFFSKEEIEYSLKSVNRYERLAARFSAKEAVVKALNNKKIKLKEIKVINEFSGKPGVSIKNLKGINFEISISHCKTYACAVCLAYKK
jgi:holo-[acyl-carrier protein] synthase